MPKATTATQQADHRLALAALEKQRRQEKPTREEAAALRRFEAARDEQLRADHFASVRKKEWRAWSGRQDKVLNEQAHRYGIPIGGATISLPVVAKWIHDFLAEHGRKLLGADDDDPAIAGANSPYLEETRKWRAKLAECDYQIRIGQLIPRDQMQAACALAAANLRRCGEQLGRRCGVEAQQILNEALDSALTALSRLLADPVADAANEDEPDA